MAYIDLSKAFDPEQHSLLWSVLFRIGVEGKMLRMLKSMYCTVEAGVRSGSEKHRVFQVFAGPQTGMLSKPKSVLPVHKRDGA